ncbi:MAG: hypothetical protein NC039_09140 [Muribaculaceae bacterium]|nr:hypothetical protein [Muribaculaceae bacterium]
MNILSVETLPGMNASAAFIPSDIVFREDRDITPVPIGDSSVSYMPWGANNMLPFDLIEKFEQDETLSVCRDFQAETLYAAGLQYRQRDTASTPSSLIASEIEAFTLDNDLPAYFLGICRDLRMFEFAVTVLILSEDGTRITNIHRKEAAYCRFQKADPDGTIPAVLYANWRLPVTDLSQVEMLPLIDPRRPRTHLRRLAAAGVRKMAAVTRLPQTDSLYYPIPTYGALFRGKWYNIKRYIAIAKEAKIKNSAPIKYLIEISQRYWDTLFMAEHIVDPARQLMKVNEVKQEMIDFLTGARNSGKAIFAGYLSTPDGKESHDIKITKIESDVEGGDWASDHAEAINMLCFAMRVHSNLVGSVPGKAQSNNSGSDKRELYTIAQAMQKSYRECALRLHRLIIDHNGWAGVEPVCPIIQLTTLDAHADSREIPA